MDEESKRLLQEQGIKITEIQKSVEKTRKYMLVSLIISVVVFVLPLALLLIIAPIVFNTISPSYGGLL